jgi:hypothetical protein
LSPAWIGLIGALGGVTLGGVLAEVSNRFQWKRSEGTRWHEERKGLYARFLAQADEVNVVLQKAEQAGKRGVGSSENDVAEIANGLTALYVSRREIDLVGGKTARDAAGRVTDSLSGFVATQVGPTTEAGRRYQVDAGEQIVERKAAVDAFIAAARKEIGIES